MRTTVQHICEKISKCLCEDKRHVQQNRGEFDTVSIQHVEKPNLLGSAKTPIWNSDEKNVQRVYQGVKDWRWWILSSGQAAHSSKLFCGVIIIWQVNRVLTWLSVYQVALSALKEYEEQSEWRKYKECLQLVVLQLHETMGSCSYNRLS